MPLAKYLFPLQGHLPSLDRGDRSRLRSLFPGRALSVRLSVKLGHGGAMKILVELLLCFLHPVAVVLMWINLVSRSDLSTVGKLAWAIFGLIPFVPFLYVLTGGDLF